MDGVGSGRGCSLFIYITLIAAWTLARDETFYCEFSSRALCLLLWKHFQCCFSVLFGSRIIILPLCLSARNTPYRRNTAFPLPLGSLYVRRVKFSKRVFNGRADCSMKTLSVLKTAFLYSIHLRIIKEVLAVSRWKVFALNLSALARVLYCILAAGVFVNFITCYVCVCERFTNLE